MAITEAEKKVLLERLEKARIAKQAKQAERNAAKAKEKPAPPAAEPVAPPPAPPAAEPVPIPTPEPVIEKPTETIPPPVPNLVKANKKPAKKVRMESEDDESEDEEEIKLPPKKKQAVKKEMPFMKLKIYKEPTNAAAFQQMLEALSNPAEYEDERPPPSAPIDIPPQKPPRQLVKQSNNVVKPMNDARAMALSFFG